MLLGGAVAAVALLSTDGSQEGTAVGAAGTTTTQSQTTTAPAIRTVTVPTLKGLSVNGAEARARRQDLTLTLVYATSKRTPEGVIARQRPRPGSSVEAGGSVRVTVSTGPPPVTVPSLKGESTAQAQSELSSLGLTSSIRQVASSKPAGTVIRSSPSSGASVPAGTTVQLTVARTKTWNTVGTYTLDSDGSTPSFRISGRQWRISYVAEELSCDYDLIDCDPPTLEIDQVSGGYGYEQASMSRGQHTIAGPDGPGRFKFEIRSYSGEWSVRLTVEQLS